MALLMTALILLGHTLMSCHTYLYPNQRQDYWNPLLLYRRVYISNNKLTCWSYLPQDRSTQESYPFGTLLRFTGDIFQFINQFSW